MAFEGLSEKLQGALKKMTGRGKLTEAAVKEGMREVRMALLEADVNYAVAKDFIKKVTERCVGQEILSSLMSMTDYHTDPVHIAFTQSFLLRSRADWLYGMNVSRIMSVRLGSAMNVGRVKAPPMKLS